MKKKGFLGYRQYVIAGLLIALAAVGTTALYSSRQEKEREQMEAELAEENNAAETEETEAAQSIQTTGKAQTLHFSEELLWPMEGNVIINYSMDSTVYFPTLDQYKYNPAVIIAGEVNDKVYAVAKGQIKSIENDEAVQLRSIWVMAMRQFTDS